MSLIRWILKPVIRKEVKRLMKDLIQPIVDLIKSLVQPQQGTKFLVTLAGLGSIFLLRKQGLGDPTTIIVIGLMVVSYYVADIFYKLKRKDGGTNP